jgi:hypothetical protein
MKIPRRIALFCRKTRGNLGGECKGNVSQFKAKIHFLRLKTPDFLFT